MDYQLDTASIKQSLDALADRHERIARALAQVGYPEERRRDHSFETLARIVVGQQVSVAAATSINKKFVDNQMRHVLESFWMVCQSSVTKTLWR